MDIERFKEILNMTPEERQREIDKWLTKEEQAELDELLKKDIYEVFLLTGERVGCTSNSLEIGEEVQFASMDGVSKVYIVNDISHKEKFYFVTEMEKYHKIC